MPQGWHNSLLKMVPGIRSGNRPDAPKALRAGRTASAVRQWGGACAGLAGRGPELFRGAALLGLVLLISWCLPGAAHSANNGDQIINRALLSTQEFTAVATSVTVTVVTRTASTTEFLKYAPGMAGAVSVPVATTSFLNESGSLTPLAPPVTAGTLTPIDLSYPVPLLPFGTFHKGEPVFLRVTDLDQNVDRNRTETVLVTVSDPGTGDSETLQLTESGPDTGVFIGYLQTSATTSAAKSGTLSVVEDSSMTARYIDSVDGTDSSASAALVDPFGIIFNSVTGNPVDGVKVELLNADLSPAIVLGDNGLSSNLFPSTVTSGGTASDQEGRVYSFNPGSYRFPYVAPGSYLLRLTPPAGFAFPSTVSITAIQALAGGPFTILGDGSFGQLFSVPAGPAIRVDIPIDPKSGTLWLSKSAGKSMVSAGEYLSYEVNLENTDPVGTVFSAVVIDRLPPGFQYRKGSARLNGAVLGDPALSADGSTLSFTIGDIAPRTSALLRYVTGVGAGAKPGLAVNIATALSTPALSSNAASATVTVQEPFLQSRNIVMGRVIVGACSDSAKDNKKGMEGVGIYLEDGSFVISDKRGMFHFEGVHSGSHVVQLDIDSIPEGYQVVSCESNSRFAGRAYSQFVDLQGGTMWRTDFHLEKAGPRLTPPTAEEITLQRLARAQSAAEAPQAPAKGPGEAAAVADAYKGEITLEMISSQSGAFIDYRIPLQAATVPLSNLQLSVTLPPGAVYQKGSSSFDGVALADPEVSSGVLPYHLGDAGADWHKELHFRVALDGKAKGGELETRAALTFDSPGAQGVSAPAVDNLLSLVREGSTVSLPSIVLHPQFPTFGAELSREDQKQLDDLAQVLKRFKMNRIDVTGHTDTVRIAPRSRKIHADNDALSFARAKSVGRYLTASLHLPPESLNLNGHGEREPVASNRSVAGRAQNRRVEVKASLSQEIETSHLKLIKDRSGLKKRETAGAPVRPTAEAGNRLAPLQPTQETMVLRAAAHASETSLSEPVLPAAKATAVAAEPGSTQQKAPAAAPQLVGLQQKAPAAASRPDGLQEKIAQPASSTARKNGAAVPPATLHGGVELVSALSDGIVHYRIKLVGVKGAVKTVTATLATPKSHLYLTGSSRLSGQPVADPETKEATISYSQAMPAEGKKFDLRLQAIIDGEDQAELQASSVTVVLADSDGKTLKTYTANCELSDSMEEINRLDIPVVEKPPRQDMTAKEEAEIFNEYVEKVAVKGATGAAETANPDAGLHVRENEGILYPANGSIIASQVNAVRVVLNSALTPVLTLDGKVIPADRIGFSMKDRGSEKSLYTYIGADFGAAGEHILQLKGMDPFGVARFDASAQVTLTGEITSIRLVSAEGNIADGKAPVKVRVQMFDKDGKPVLANAELAVKAGDLRPVSATGNTGRDAGTGMVSVDAEGWLSFQPVSSSGVYRAQLSYNKATLDIETYVKPKLRDWILVGIAEGSAGYNVVSGHLDNLKASGAEDGFYDQERLAFYAKGTIKGEWLLTTSYDSAKQRTGVNGNALFQSIDPNAFYTIYGDAGTQGYDAASQKKLFLKIERDQFYAMYGDYDTGLSVTELSRYSRRLNGVKTEFRSRDYELNAFGSETGQSFAKDEIRGDGSSGLYRLSKKAIVINSEKIRIESRDRFHSETVTESRPMTRFIDYSIDYDAGTIFFKSPVWSRDELLNPVYIVVDYEVVDAGRDALTLGGRAGAKLLDGNLRLGASYVHEGQVKGENHLYGADAVLALGPGTKLRAEVATSNSDSGTVKANGTAYLAEVVHTGKALDAKAYYREQDGGFGLGQQAASENSTRKFGSELAYRLSNSTVLSAQAYRQDNLTSGTVRDFIESLASYSEKDKAFSARGGLRYASDTLSDGSHASSVVATLGGSWKTFNQRLTLRADHDQALFGKNSSTDFPTRSILGADYQATKEVTVFAQEELTYGAAANTNTTRVGVKATPWSGGTVSSSVVNDLREDSDRTFATVGLAQKWQLTPAWSVDGGLDHSQTVRKKAGYQLNANVPPASGGEDFTAVSAGANFQEKKLTWSNRVEYRTSDTDTKWGLITGVMNEQGLYWGWTGRLQVLHTRSSLGSSGTDADLRLGLAYRPPVTRWIVLDRLDLISNDNTGSTFASRGKRIINNLNANYRPGREFQLSLQYGAKYVLEQIDATDYSGFSDLVGAEGRYDLTKDCDIGLRGSILHTWELHQLSYSLGASVGYNLMENGWLSLGYNLLGFRDKDFSAASFTAKGPFVQFRFKFDQNSIKDGLLALNR